MPLINNPIEFSADSRALIDRTESTLGFTHHNWSDDELLPVRREVREYYRNAQRLRCAYCWNLVSDVAAEGAPIDHIVPKSLHQAFTFEPKNLCVTCPDCNAIKRAREVLADYEEPINPDAIRYPRTSNAFKIVHPHFDEYTEHIYKAEKAYIDLSDKGLWTIGVCRLNRFFHRFGASDELLASIEIIEQEERFHEAQH